VTTKEAFQGGGMVLYLDCGGDAMNLRMLHLWNCILKSPF
jgi:hypothetical protein